MNGTYALSQGGSSLCWSFWNGTYFPCCSWSIRIIRESPVDCEPQSFGIAFCLFTIPGLSGTWASVLLDATKGGVPNRSYTFYLSGDRQQLSDVRCRELDLLSPGTRGWFLVSGSFANAGDCDTGNLADYPPTIFWNTGTVRILGPDL
jgi:hypothetical protein